MENKLMMRLFIASEVFFFLSLIVAYVYFWQSAHFREEALQHLDIKSSAVFTGLLIGSSFSFMMAEKQHQLSKWKRANMWLLLTILLGLVFLGGQAHEYYKLITHDMSLSKDEFGTSFFTLTGFHALHVLLGLILLSVLFGISAKGFLRNNKSSVFSVAGIYWHFVDVVWIFVFTLIYVIPHFTGL